MISAVSSAWRNASRTTASTSLRRSMGMPATIFLRASSASSISAVSVSCADLGQRASAAIPRCPRCSSSSSLRCWSSCSLNALSPSRRPRSYAACSRSRQTAASPAGAPASRRTSRSGSVEAGLCQTISFSVAAGFVQFNFTFGFELADGVNDAELRGLDVAQLDVAEKRHFFLHGFGGAAGNVARATVFSAARWPF